MRGGMLSIITGVLVIVVGLVLSGTILTQAADSGSSGNIASFTGAQALNDLIPLLYYAGLVVISLGLMGLGGRSVYQASRR